MKTRQGFLSLKANIKTTLIIFSWKGKNQWPWQNFCLSFSLLQNKTKPRQHVRPKPIKRQSPSRKKHSLFNHWRCFKMGILGGFQKLHCSGSK